jgi:hypothetical protein
VSDYGLDDRAIDIRSPTVADFSSSPCFQTGSGAHPVSYPMGTGGSFPGGKARPRRDADHSPPSSAEVKNEYELYLLSPHVPPWHVAGQLYFFFLLLLAMGYFYSSCNIISQSQLFLLAILEQVYLNLT